MARKNVGETALRKIMNSIATSMTDLYSQQLESANEYTDTKISGVNSTLATKLPLSGGTMTGTLTLKASQFTEGSSLSATLAGLNANNSNIKGINSLYFADQSDSAGEGISFPVQGNATTMVDTIWCSSGKLLFSPNRTLGAGASSITSYEVAHEHNIAGIIADKFSSGSLALSDIGAADIDHTHDEYLPLSGGTLTGNVENQGSNFQLVSDDEMNVSQLSSKCLSFGYDVNSYEVAHRYDFDTNRLWTFTAGYNEYNIPEIKSTLWDDGAAEGILDLSVIYGTNTSGAKEVFEFYVYGDPNTSTVNNSAFSPATSVCDLGFAGLSLWNNIYAKNGTIQTSDRNEKNTIVSLENDHAKSFIMGLNPVSYQFNNGTSGRTHYGLIAQDVEDLMNELGMESTDFAGFIKSPKVITEYETRTDSQGKEYQKKVFKEVEGEYKYSLRYDEFIAPMIKVIQMQQQQIEELQNKIDSLVGTN